MVIAASMCIAVLVVTPRASAPEEFALLLVTLPVWLALFKLYGLYDRDSKRITHPTIDDVPTLFHALVVGSLALWAFSKLFLPDRLELIQGLAFFALSMTGIVAGRAAARGLLAPRIVRDRALLIGGGPMAEIVTRKIESHPEFGLDVVGRLGTADGSGLVEGGPRLAGVDRVIVVSGGLPQGLLVDVLRRCSELEIKVSVVPHLVDAIGSAVEIDDLEGVTVLGINPPTLSRSSRFVKRLMDVAVASTVLLLALPVMLAAAIAIKLTSAGPVLYRQERVGLGGRSFRIFKFRTMFRDADERAAELRMHSAHPAWLLLEHDPRITSVGQVLRRASIDELPQLLNVLHGDMSLVGPRPMTPDVDRLIDGWGRRRLDLTPGITGLWQALGRTSIPFEEMVNLDYLYVTNWSLWQDVRILIHTLPTIVTGHGAN